MPRRLAYGLMLILICFAFYCQHTKPRTEESFPATPQLRLERYFDTRSLMYGSTRAEIIRNLGKPKLERTEKDLEKAMQLSPDEKRYLLGHTAEPINQINELVYDGLSLRILKVNSQPYNEFVYDIIVTSDKYKLLWNLTVGSTRQKVIRILGNPSYSDDIKDSYDVVHSSPPEGYTDLVTFSYSKNRIIRIHFSLYID